MKILLGGSITPVAYSPDEPPPLSDGEAELLLILLHRYHQNSPEWPTHDVTLEEIVSDLAMSMSPTTDLADRIRRDLGA